eukprot:gene41327-50825_t
MTAFAPVKTAIPKPAAKAKAAAPAAPAAPKCPADKT